MRTEPTRASATGGKLRGKALTCAKCAVYIADVVLLYLILRVHLGLGDAELFIKFALLFVIVWGPVVLIDRLEGRGRLRR